VLDEPTNHLDMQSKEILKNALIHFSGTIIVVSHDREFLDGMVDCVFEFRNKKIKQHLGGIYEFLQKKKMESLKELEAANKKSQSRKSSARKAVSNTPDLSFEERKEILKSITRFEKKVENTEDEIEKLETEISEMDELLSSSEVVNDSSVFKKYDELKATLGETLKRWEREHEELENWKKKKYW
jgi:ATP-binding cassette subfamily F protein 3